ncbi:regulatory factor X-associated protein isoform X1 [Anguilla anguilla]|uniref:regulatory factor X-associated protein isoform X1 n=1 Tax=Anguilla anguilla TaxID=7936 RepID=UPI0015B1FD28|nr:regulatory factor X-associated protein isoform X1 [Anguilla anguilla]XP_035290239.1 regulatory factor X-associated protein isoform X1 [Anguilla anguilla]
MSEEDNATCTTPVNKDSNISLLLTKDGQTYFVDKSGVVESRNVVTPQEPDTVFPFDMEDPGDESDVLDTTDPRDSTASPEAEELNDEEAFGDSENVTKTCTYEGCHETTTQVAKQRKPWMCKKHRNKMYKDKYKKKKSDQAMSSGKLDQESSEERPVSVTKQRLGTVGDRPARPSLIEQVLNQKRLSLLRSPEVISFLQEQQRLLTSQARAQTQQDF